MPYGKSAFGFEDLELYRAARSYRKSIYSLIESLPVDERFALAQQMRRAAVSLTNNIAEGYGRYNWQETIQFIRQSRGSLMELVDDLNICEDQSYADASLLRQIQADSKGVLRLLNGYIRYLEQRKATSKQGKPKVAN